MPCLAPQPCGQLGRQRQLGFLHAKAIALHIAKAERQRRLVDIRQLLAEERLMLGLADTQARLGHIVAIRHGGLDRRRALQEANQLLTDHLQGGVVEDDVLELQGGFDAPAARCLAMKQTNQRRLAQVQANGSRIVVAQDLQRCVTPDHLHSLRQAVP